MQLMHWLFGAYEGNSFIVFLVEYLPYIILAAIAGFIIWLFIRLNPGNKLLARQEQGQVLMSDEEDIIKRQNIPELIQEALQDNNYRLAVRYLYLQSLKALTSKEIIDYQFDKTNADYLSEITKESLKSAFKDVTHIYDFTWYGNFEINETDYLRASKKFKTLEQLL